MIALVGRSRAYRDVWAGLCFPTIAGYAVAPGLVIRRGGEPHAM